MLSRRESEIADLAAAGLSNKEIAQRLIIGERTVESHLYRVFTKLGISSRDQIAGALRPDRLPGPARLGPAGRVSARRW